MIYPLQLNDYIEPCCKDSELMTEDSRCSIYCSKCKQAIFSDPRDHLSFTSSDCIMAHMQALQEYGPDLISDEKLSKLVPSTYNLNYYKHIFELAINNLSGGLVADIGCGTGYFVRLLAQYAQFAIGFDLNPMAIKLGLQSLIGSSIDLEFWNEWPESTSISIRLPPPSRHKTFLGVYEVPPIPLRTGCTSLVLCLNVLDIVQNPIQLIDEISRISSPAAVVIASSPGLWQQRNSKGQASITNKVLWEKFESAGFTCLKSEEILFTSRPNINSRGLFLSELRTWKKIF